MSDVLPAYDFGCIAPEYSRSLIDITEEDIKMALIILYQNDLDDYILGTVNG